MQVASLSELRATASDAIYAMRLNELFDRISACRQRYWDIPKAVRIECGLRPVLNEHSYSGARVVDLCADLVAHALRGVYPFRSEKIEAFVEFGGDKHFESSKEVVEFVERKISELEAKLDLCDQNREKIG